jgi:hypothetical protein
MDPYIYHAGGYLTNLDSIVACRFYSSRTTDEFFELSLIIKYVVPAQAKKHWDLCCTHRVRCHFAFLTFVFADLLVALFFDLSLDVFAPNEVMGPVVVFEVAEGVCTRVSSVFGPPCFPHTIHNPNLPRSYQICNSRSFPVRCRNRL